MPTFLLLLLAIADPGVTDQALVVRQPAAFTGPSAGLGTEMWRGATAQKAAVAASQLLARDHVLALGGGVGTPTIVEALRVVLEHDLADGLFCNATGAQPQRHPPYEPAAFNVRASSREEPRAMVDAFVKTGKERIGLFVQDDAYGASGRDEVRRALENLSPAADTSSPHGQPFDVSMAPQVQVLQDAHAEAVTALGSRQACAVLE